MNIIKRKCFVFDIDDCIYDFLGYLCFIFNAINRTSITPSDINSWDIDDTTIQDSSGRIIQGKEIIDVMKRFTHHGLYSSMPLLLGADQALSTIKDKGYDIVLLTARPTECGEDTYLNLLRDKIPFTEVIFDWDKAKVINELSNRYDIKMFVDDKRETVNVVAEKCNVETICIMNKAHNRTGEVNEKIKRIDTLTECIKYVK